MAADAKFEKDTSEVNFFEASNGKELTERFKEIAKKHEPKFDVSAEKISKAILDELTVEVVNQVVSDYL